MILNWLCTGLGCLVVLWGLNDLFQSAIVPRAVGNRYRLSFNLRRALWFVWPKIALRFYAGNDERREDFLAIFAPFALVLIILMWAVMLVLGYALIFYGLRGGLSPQVESFGVAAYFAGTSFTTIGFGDFAGHSAATRFFSVCAGISGLAVFSITTAYLFALFGSFQKRESFVVMIGARAGTPPSGVNLLAIAGLSKTDGHLESLMIDAQRWASAVMESHLAYPILGFFRSSHDYQSWVGTLGTLLDAATLLMTAVDGVPSGQARIFYNVGRHAALDLSKYYRARALAERPLVERSEFDHACDRLVSAGYRVGDRDIAWGRFAALRSTYAAHLNAMAKQFLIPPLQWIGDRSELGHTPH